MCLASSLEKYLAIFTRYFFLSLCLNPLQASVPKHQEPATKTIPVPTLIQAEESEQEGRSGAERMECAGDLYNHYWNSAAKYGDAFGPDDYFAGVKKSMAERLTENKKKILSSYEGNREVSPQKIVFNVFIEKIKNVEGFLKNTKAEIIQKSNSLDALEHNPKRDEASYESIANELATLWGTRIPQIARANIWIQAQSMDTQDILKDVYLTTDDPLSPHRGMDFIGQAKPLKEVYLEDFKKTQNKNWRGLSSLVPWTRQKRDDLKAQIPLIDELIEKNRQMLHSFETAQNKSPSQILGLDELSLNDWPAAPSVFSTYQDAISYIDKIRELLLKNKLLGDCPYKIFLSHEGYQHISAVRQTPPIDPWEVAPHSKDASDLALDLFHPNFVQCQDDFETQIRNWSSEVMRSSPSKEEFHEELEKALTIRDQMSTANRISSTRNKKLQRVTKLLQTAETVRINMNRAWNSYAYFARDITHQEFAELIDKLEENFVFISGSKERILRTQMHFMPEGDLLTGPQETLAQHRYPAHPQDWGREGPKEELKKRYENLSKRLDSYIIALKDLKEENMGNTEETPKLLDLTKLKNFTTKLLESRDQKSWRPLVRHSGDAEKKLGQQIDLIKKDFIKAGMLKDCSASKYFSADAQLDMKAMEAATDKENFYSLVEEIAQKDKSCTQVVTGKKGQTSAAEILKHYPNGTNVSPHIPYFTAEAFVQLACRDWREKNLSTKRSTSRGEWQKTHPYLRPAISSDKDEAYDALNKENFITPPSHANLEISTRNYSKVGIENLIMGSSLVYSLIERETAGNPMLPNTVYKEAENKDTGLTHTSASSMGDDNGFWNTKSQHTNAIWPFAADLLKEYVQKVRSLAKDESPYGKKRFESFCGTHHFKDKYDSFFSNATNRALGASPQDVLNRVLNEKSLGRTCDQHLEKTQPVNYKTGNITHCYRNLQMFCPNYGFAHANLVVRGMAMNQGPLRSSDTGVRPACRKLFSDLLDLIHKDRNSVCKLVENFQ
jgi:hypothetical protein